MIEHDVVSNRRLAFLSGPDGNRIPLWQCAQLHGRA